MERLITIIGLLYFVDAMFMKFLVWDKIESKARLSRIKFIYRLANCRFCLMFHIGWILTIIYGTITGLCIELVFVPFVVSGLIHLKEKI